MLECVSAIAPSRRQHVWLAIARPLQTSPWTNPSMSGQPDVQASPFAASECVKTRSQEAPSCVALSFCVLQRKYAFQRAPSCCTFHPCVPVGVQLWIACTTAGEGSGQPSTRSRLYSDAENGIQQTSFGPVVFG